MIGGRRWWAERDGRGEDLVREEISSLRRRLAGERFAEELIFEVALGSEAEEVRQFRVSPWDTASLGSSP